jgi:hypothetical protein
MGNTYFDISPDVVARAAECEKNHTCLENTSNELCKGQYVSLEKFCCLEEICEEGCIYCVKLGDESICGCPVRIEIFNKYNV